MAHRPTQGPSPGDEAAQRVSKRLSEGLDSVSERLDAGFASVRGAVDDLADHVRRVDARVSAKLEDQAATLTRELGQLEIGVGELRDRVAHLEDTTLPNQAALAAEGAARGAAEAAGRTAAITAKVTAAQVAKGFWATSLGKLVAGAAAFTALVTGVGALPTAAKGLTKFWLFLTGLK